MYNRGFWEGYYRGKTTDMWSGTYGSKATTKKVYTGFCQNYFNKNKIAQFMLDAHDLNLINEIIITGPTTGVIKTKLTSMYVNDKESKIAKKGSIITFPINKKIRENDRLYFIIENKQK